MTTVNEITGLYSTPVAPLIPKRAVNKIQKGLVRISLRRSYYIPVDDIEVVLNECGYHLIQEDGERWSGVFCGRDSSCYLQFADAAGNVPKHLIALQWYKGEFVETYEINCYLT